MLQLTPDMAAHLGAAVATLAPCWRVARRDGVVLGFTGHDRDLEIDGSLYRAAPSFLPSAVAGGSDFAVDNMEVEGVLSAAAIGADDLATGRFDHARIDIFLVDWAAPAAGRLPLRSGTLGEVRSEDGRFVAELRGLKEALQQPVGELFSPECRADLGDRRCRVSLRDFTVAGTVAAVLTPNRFTAALAKPDDWFHYGRLRWHSGANAGLDFEVKADQAGAITLVSSPPAALAPGDAFEVEAGCDKRFATCRDKFANAINFRGEPFVPGVDALLDYPGLQ